MDIEEKFIKAVLTMYVVLDEELRPTHEAEVEDVVVHLAMDNNTATRLAESINLFTDCQRIGKNGEVKPPIDRITIGRFIGAYGNTRGHISRKNLQVLAKYLGYKSWDEVLRERSLTAHILSKAAFTKAQEIKSVYDNANRLFSDSSIDYLLPTNIPAGYYVDVLYGNHGKHIKLRKLKDTGDCFVIMESDSKLIKKGWCVTIPFFILDNNLICTYVRMNGARISSLYKSSGRVNSINVSMF